MKHFLNILVVLAIVFACGCAGVGVTETQRETSLAAIAGNNPAVGGRAWGVTGHIIGQPNIPPLGPAPR